MFKDGNPLRRHAAESPEAAPIPLRILEFPRNDLESIPRMFEEAKALARSLGGRIAATRELKRIKAHPEAYASILDRGHYYLFDATEDGKQELWSLSRANFPYEDRKISFHTNARGKFPLAEDAKDRKAWAGNLAFVMVAEA